MLVWYWFGDRCKFEHDTNDDKGIIISHSDRPMPCRLVSTQADPQNVVAQLVTNYRQPKVPNIAN